ILNDIIQNIKYNNEIYSQLLENLIKDPISTLRDKQRVPSMIMILGLIGFITISSVSTRTPIALLTESTSTEPTLAEPTSTEPTLAEPTSTEPTLAEPTSTEPTLAEPTSTEPTLAEPTHASVK